MLKSDNAGLIGFVRNFRDFSWPSLQFNEVVYLFFFFCLRFWGFSFCSNSLRPLFSSQSTESAENKTRCLSKPKAIFKVTTFYSLFHSSSQQKLHTNNYNTAKPPGLAKKFALVWAVKSKSSMLLRESCSPQLKQAVCHSESLSLN